MEVTQTRADGLARELKVTVPAATLDERLTAYLDDLRAKVRLKGFRPGKVPMTHLRKMYGKSAMAEVINDVMTETVRSAVENRAEKPALQPDVNLDEAAMPAVVDGKSDLVFDISYEVLPTITVSGLDEIAIERPVVAIDEAEVDAEIKTIAEANRDYSVVERAAADGDRLKIDFVGTVDGVAFDGGSAEDVDIVIGAGRFIPGFEEQLAGASAGDDATVKVTFPENYPAAELAGKSAEFAVKVKEVAAPGEVAIDDALGERLGLDDLAALKEAVRQQMSRASEGASRQRVKRALLDALDERFKFELPEKLVETEFATIWRQVEAEHRESGAEGAPDEAQRADYRAIAERRVRLGLLLSEVGTGAEVKVTDEEVQRALTERLRQFPGQEREVVEYYRQNPQALASLRAPIFEDKVVDYLLELVTVTDKSVTKEELKAMAEADEEHDHDHHDHGHDHGHHHHDHDHDH